VTRWRDGDGILRGQARTSAADIGREVDKPRSRAHDWLKRWASIGAISYEVEVDEANRPTGIVVTVLGYERWAANAKAYANHADDSGVSGEVPDAKAYADARPDAKAYARPDAKAYAGNIDGNGVSEQAAYARPDAAPDARPDASCIGHDQGHAVEEETRASALPPSLPGLDSPEGVDGRQTDPSPTPPATAPTALSVGAVPGAVDPLLCPERLTYAAVRDLWAETWRMRYEHGMPTGLGGRSCPVTRLLTTMQQDAATKPLADVWEGVATVLEAFVYDDDDWLRSRQHPLAYALKHWAKYDRPRAMTKLQEALTVGAHVEERAVDQPVEAVAQASPPEPVTLQTYRRATGDDADDARELLRQLVDEGLPDIDGGTLCADGDDLVLVFADELAAMVAERRLTRYVDGLRCAHGEVVR